MKKLLQKTSSRGTSGTDQVSGRSANRSLLTRAFAFLVLCGFVALPELGLAQATVTDPALTSINYKAAKSGQAKKAGKKNNFSGIAHSASGNAAARVANPAGNVAGSQVNSFRSGGACFIPRDASYTAVPRNDDGSYGPIALGFDFNLYGTTYNQVWINTNGNLTFNGPLAMYNPLGFPYNVPMIAGFWADVDTEIGGQIFFKQTASSIIVTWDAVEPYGSEGDYSNTFQIILTDGLDPLLGAGRNVALNHLNIEWAFGAASIFEPATVGINHGNGANYVQIGLFLFNNNTYDGPGGNYDGLYHLNGLCSNFNVANAGNIEPSSSNFPQNNTVTLKVGQTITINPQFIGPETDQTVTTTINTNGMCGVTSSVSNGSVSTASITITGSACNAGTNVITITATDNGTPAETTVETIIVHVISPCNTVLSAAKTDESCAGSANGSVDLSVTGGTAPFTYSWSNGAATQDLVNVAAGAYTVTVTDANNCVATTTVTVGTATGVTPVPAISVARYGSTVNTGAGVNTIFLGYGNQAVTLAASAAATSYSWSPATGLSNANVANPVFAPTAAGTYTFTVTAANEFGCTGTISVTIEVVNVRGGSKKDKVEICHGGNKINVSPSAVQAHLAHGCTIGACGSAVARGANVIAEPAAVLEVFPNPFSDRTNLEFSVTQDSRYTLEVLNIKGSVVKVMEEGNAKAGKYYSVEFAAGTLAEGVYIIRLTTETEVKHVKMVLKH